jgi:carboxypeptidase PM20D1
MRTTTAVTMLSGSPKENVLPSQAVATVNFRILPGDTTQSVLEHVRGLVGGDSLEVRMKSQGRDPSPVSPTDAPAFGLLHRTIEEIFPDAVVAPGLVLAGTDSRHYAAITPNVYRFAPFRYDADDLKRPHGIDERMSVAGFLDGVRFYVRLVENASGAFAAP